MHHEILGEIILDGESGDRIATISYGSRQVNVRLMPDDQAFEATLRLAEGVVGRLDEFDAIAKQVAVADLRETYNTGWNEFDEAQPDGSLKTVSNPQLSEAEFKRKLSLNAINVTGDQMIDFFYDDENMFWGHSVVVNSLNGLDFTKATAELFG